MSKKRRGTQLLLGAAQFTFLWREPVNNPFCENDSVYEVLQIVSNPSLLVQTRRDMLFVLSRLAQQCNETEQAYLLRHLRDVHAYMSDQQLRDDLVLCFALLGDRVAYRHVSSAFVREGASLPTWWQERVRAYLRRFA